MPRESLSWNAATASAATTTQTYQHTFVFSASVVSIHKLVAEATRVATTLVNESIVTQCTISGTDVTVTVKKGTNAGASLICGMFVSVITV